MWQKKDDYIKDRQENKYGYAKTEDYHAKILQISYRLKK